MKTLSLELSRELTELCKSKGITMPESYFCYFESMQTHAVKIGLAKNKMFPIAPAYTLDELMDWLPSSVYKLYPSGKGVVSLLILNKADDGYGALYEFPRDSYYEALAEFTEDNPCDAVGKLLMWCIKEGYLNQL
jgi:hypothetical protein